MFFHIIKLKSSIQLIRRDFGIMEFIRLSFHFQALIIIWNNLSSKSLLLINQLFLKLVFSFLLFPYLFLLILLKYLVDLFISPFHAVFINYFFILKSRKDE